MRRYELWGGSFFPEHNTKARQMVIEDGSSLDWECWAEGWIPAMQQMHEHCGYGEYKPMLRSDGTHYPQDLLDWRCIRCQAYFGPGRSCPECGHLVEASLQSDQR